VPGEKTRRGEKLGRCQKAQTGFSRPPGTIYSAGGVAVAGELQALDDAEAEAMLAASRHANLRYFDTSPLYGRRLSEVRIGRFLRPRRSLEDGTRSSLGREGGLEPAEAAAAVTVPLLARSPPVRPRFVSMVKVVHGAARPRPGNGE